MTCIEQLNLSTEELLFTRCWQVGTSAPLALLQALPVCLNIRLDKYLVPTERHIVKQNLSICNITALYLQGLRVVLTVMKYKKG